MSIHPELFLTIMQQLCTETFRKEAWMQVFKRPMTSIKYPFIVDFIASNGSNIDGDEV
jgi:hypothetical protein